MSNWSYTQKDEKPCIVNFYVYICNKFTVINEEVFSYFWFYSGTDVFYIFRKRWNQ